ncbi:MAG: class I adenylate-forming enzyme family protein [Desulfomonilaceae bacterium]
MNPELTFTRFEKACEKYPNNAAIIFLGEKFSFRKLRDMVDRFATGLAGLGLKKGDRIILYLSNCVQYVIAFLAAQKLGLVVVLVSPIYTSHELEYMVNDSGARAIVCHDTNYGYVKEVIHKTTLEKIICTNLIDLVNPIKRLVAYLFDKKPHGTVKGGDETIPFKKLLGSPANPPKVSIDPIKDLSYILYTGGTTGFPKGVPGNHWGHTSYVNDITDWLTVGHLKHGEDVYIAINPLFHIMALGLFMAIGLNVGATTVLMPVPQVDSILMEIQRRKARWMLGVPALYRMILENDRQDTYDISSLRYCFCGGDVLPREVLQRWKERANIPIYQVYGSTEAGHVSYSPLDAGDPAPMSIGKPLPSRKPLIVDSETLTEVPVGEVGELVVTSAHAMKEYLNKPQETVTSFVKIGDDVYYRTSDYVRGSENGEIFYVERSADILKHKGYRVSASEVEAVLQDHPVVVGACVIGVPDPKVGERIKAIVVLKDDAKGVGAAELINWCSSQLAAYKVPSYIEFRDMLPKSKVGKLLRREIRDEEKRKAQKDKK